MMTTGSRGNVQSPAVLKKDDGAQKVTYKLTAAAIARTIENKLKKYVDVIDFGAFGDGSDQTTQIQNAIDYLESIGGGTLYFPAGDYRVSKQSGTNDKWGINIKSSKINLVGEDGAEIRRFSSDISTYAKAFPILLIGKPDSDDIADQITKIKIKNIAFIGENTRHASSGNAVMDGRQSIWIKNTKHYTIYGCDFESVDSGSIWIQSPGEYDYENSAYYNKTKCYDGKIIQNNFEAEAHAVAGRALIHAIVSKGDRTKILHNDFSWCDCGIDAESTYDNYSDKETDTYTDSNLAALVKRSGKTLTLNGNNFYNSSEHCLYLNGMAINCTGGTITVDEPTICTTNQIQIRGRGVTVTGIEMTGVASACHITTGASDVIYHNNADVSGDTEGGAINIQSQGLTAYINARSDYLGSYKPMRNITVGGAIRMPSASQTYGYGVRLYTDVTDANFPGGQMINININGLTIDNPRMAFLNIANMAENVKVSKCILNGKPFTKTSFTTGTVMNSLAAFGIDDSLTSPFSKWSVEGNTILGFEYILYDNGGLGSGILAPYGFRGNRMDYIKYWDTAAFNAPSWETMFDANQGSYFLDRSGWFSNVVTNNSLSDGTANSEKKSMVQLVSSTDVRIYHDDAGGFKAL